MSLATSLYDALTAINIPKNQAREVVEALEHKMTTEFAFVIKLCFVIINLEEEFPL